MMRFLALAATAAVVSAQTTPTCAERGMVLLNCARSLDYTHIDSDDDDLFDMELDKCCTASVDYSANCGEVQGYLAWWADNKDAFTDDEWRAAGQMLGRCPRSSVSDCSAQVNGMAQCLATTPAGEEPNCCMWAENYGRCEGYEFDTLWTGSLDPAMWGEKTMEAFKTCPMWSADLCDAAFEVMRDNLMTTTLMDMFEDNRMKRCTSAYAATWFCTARDDQLMARMMDAGPDMYEVMKKQTEVCNANREDEHHYSPCMNIIHDVFLHEEAGEKFLASYTCKGMCSPIPGPAGGPYMYKVAHFNEHTMEITPEECFGPEEPAH